jgi:tetratricopeptide (TPR) repeat protein
MVSKAARKRTTRSGKPGPARKRARPAGPKALEKILEEFTAAVKVFHKGDFAKARAQFSAFVEKHPGEAEIRDRVLSYLAICERNLAPRDPRLRDADDFYNHGVFLLNNGEYEEAARALEKALSLDAGNEKALYAMACVHARSGRKGEALETLREAIRANPANRILAASDTDFAEIGQDPEFAELVRSRSRGDAG